MKIEIPFNRPCLTGRELTYIAQAIESGHASGDGSFTKQCQALLEDDLGVPKALLTTSCTHALEMAAILLDIKSGDEVIIPDFTFVSTINAFVIRGAIPVFADIRPDTLNLDETQLERLITPQTKAIVPVHYAGVGCEMEDIQAIASSNDIHLVEDNAHGLFAKYRGQMLGTFGCMATQSFHETKNYTCGEGGALLINDKRLLERAEIIREKGTNRSRFFRGQVDKYTWVDIGSSYLPSDVLAAFLLGQLEFRDVIWEKRRHIWNYYFSGLQNWAELNGVRLPIVPDYCEQPFHMFYMLMPTTKERDGLVRDLKRAGILSVFHYMPLHLSKMGKKFGGTPGDCPVSQDVSERLIRLPFYNDLSESQQAHVVSTIINSL